MPYISPRGFRAGMQTGVQIGLAGNRRRREEKEEAKRAKYEEAIKDAQMRQVEELGEKEITGASMRAVERTVAGGGVGPTGLNLQAFAGEMQQVTPLERRVAQTKEIASRLPPQYREQFIFEESQRLKEQALTRARRSVMDGIQDRLSTGAYAFEGETETSPEIESRLQSLVEGLEADEIDPIQAQEIEAEILGAVKKTSQKRLLKQRGNGTIDDQLQQAIKSGNASYAGDLELLKSAWNTDELDFEDLIDKMFESKHGRKTARGSAPTELELREKAIELSVKMTGKVTEESVQQALEILQPTPELTPEQVAQNAQAYAAQVQAAQGGNGQVAPAGPGVPPALGQQTGAVPQAQQAAPEADLEQGGQPDRKWSTLPKAERAKIQARLVRAMKKGEDIQKVARSLGIDIESLPEKVEKALIRAAKG